VLDDLRAAVAAGDWVRALGLALEAWRETRAPALADLVDAIGERCTRPVPPTRAGLHDWWMEHAFTHDPVTLGALLATLNVRIADAMSWEPIRERWLARRGNPVMNALADQRFGPYVNRGLYDRVAALIEWPDDPRIARALTQCLFDPPVTLFGQWETILYGAITDRVASLRDVRVVPTLTSCVDEPRGRTDFARTQQQELAKRTLAVLAQHPPASVPGDQVAAFAALVTPPPRPRAPAVDVDALWREIAANPDDVGTRAVLGDALVEAGDLRGDLIVLQCGARKPGRPLRGAVRDRYDGRVKTLLRTEWEHWLGDLALVLVRRGSEFRCGMLEVARIGQPYTPPWTWAKIRGHRELSTVHTVRPCWATPEHFARFVAALPRDPHTLAIDSPEVLDELGKLKPQLATRSLECCKPAETYGTGTPHAAWGRLFGRPLVQAFELAARLAPAVTELRFDTPGNASVATELATELVPALPGLFPALQRIRITAATVAAIGNQAFLRIQANPLVELVPAQSS
jgi:uncharacterized protein (TIGR02996 family)